MKSPVELLFARLTPEQKKAFRDRVQLLVNEICQPALTTRTDAAEKLRQLLQEYGI